MIDKFDTSFLGIAKSSIYPIFIVIISAIESLPSDLIYIYAWLMIIDIITGVSKVVAIKDVEFSSRKMSTGILAKLLTMLIPLTISLLLKAVNLNSESFMRIAMTVLCVSEGISIFSNIQSTRTKTQIKEIDGITLLISALNNYFTKILLKITGRLEDK